MNNETKIVKIYKIEIPKIAEVCEVKKPTSIAFEHKYNIDTVISYLKRSQHDKWGPRYIDGTGNGVLFRFGNDYIVNFPKNIYFNDTITDRFTGDIDCLHIISILIDKKFSQYIKIPQIMTDIIKRFILHLNNIMYWVNKYNITEVFDFIRNILTLRYPQSIDYIDLYDYIMQRGGIEYIKRISS